MSLTMFRTPGSGRRQADPSARLAAENRRLRNQLTGAEQLIKGLFGQLDDADILRRAEVAGIAWELGELAHTIQAEQNAHQATRDQLAAAVRANAANDGATTVQTDVTALRAAMADQYIEPTNPGPEYTPYRRVASPVIRVVPLWDSPLAAGPAAINLAGAR